MAEQREKERLEAEQRENERFEADQREKDRIEAERREKQRLEAEQRKKEQLDSILSFRSHRLLRKPSGRSCCAVMSVCATWSRTMEG